MAYTYEQLGLGEHPYGLTAEERKEKKDQLQQMLEKLGMQEELLKTQEDPIKTIEEQTKRLLHQKKNGGKTDGTD